MIKNLSKKLVAAAAVLVIAAGAAGAGTVAQTTITSTIEVPPGQRRCLDHPTRAKDNASVYDYVVSGQPVKFVFLGKRDGAYEFLEISNSGPYPVLSYYDYINAPPSFPPSFFSSFFPGVFRTCAKNSSDQPSTVSLSITVDQ
jgi:hypothetical protein